MFPAMKHTCEFCQHPFESEREDARFCSTKCRVYHGRKSDMGIPISKSPPAEPKQTSIPSAKEAKPDSKMDKIRAIVAAICERKKPSPRPVWCRDASGNPKPWPDMEDVRFRLHGGHISSLKDAFGIDAFGGIKSYNRTQLRQCQPWHCQTVSGLAHLLLSLGCNPLKMLREIADIGYLPDSSESEELP